MHRECWERFPRHRGDMYRVTCVTHAGIVNYRFHLKSVAGKSFPASPLHAQPAILRIWWEVHSSYSLIHFQGVVIRNSGLQSVDPNTFTNLSALQDLMLIHGLLTQPPSLQRICKTLMLLDLQNNYIAHMDKLYFTDCMKLTTLSVERNLLSSMPDISYIVKTLTTLNLSHNQLNGTYLYFTMLFPRLHTIYLNSNHLAAFCMQQITHLPFVELISLNDNNITHVEFDFLQEWQEILCFTMYNNPLQCDRSWNSACKKHPMKPGGRLNKKDGLTRYGNSHVKDKTS